jgi:predicted amidohydrolase
MKIALIQMQMSLDLFDNLDKSLSKMEEAAKNGAKLVIFPELQLSPFFPQKSNNDASDYIVTRNHMAVENIQKKGAELNIVTVPNFYLKENSELYDACPVIDGSGSILGISKMVHIVQIPQFYEQDYYTPSDDGFKVYETRAGKLGVVICFDRHYPESMRTCVLQGAQIIIIPTAIVHGEPLDMFEWELRLASWQNNIFIAICNRVGIEDDMNFCGHSMVIDPDGEMIAQADDSEQILYCDIDYNRIISSRTRRDFIALRRPEAYL